MTSKEFLAFDPDETLEIIEYLKEKIEGILERETKEFNEL